MGTVTTTAAKNAAVDAITGQVTLVKLHSGSPGSAGTANVITDAEVAATYAAASGGSASINGTPSVPVDGGTVGSPITVSHISLWNSTTFLAHKDYAASQDFTVDGTVNITGADFDISDV